MSWKYNVVWAGVAEKDLQSIVGYIAEDSPRRALEILNGIGQKALDLYILPERGRIVPELQEQGILQYRELIVAPWRLIYRISERDVFVLSVIDSRRNVEDILFKRFIEKQ